MMSTLILITLLFSSISGKVQGTVTDAETGEPIPYANVILSGTQIGTATEENGDFFILHVPTGTYTVEISCIGYQTQYLTEVIVKVDQTVRLNVGLEPAPVAMEPITVTHEPPIVTKDMTGTTYILRESEIATLPIDYTERLIAFQPSVATYDTSLHVRGGRATEVNYMIDNVSIIDPQTGDPAIIVTKGIIDEIVFLPGGFDVEYGRAMSGVVNLITERPANRFKTKVYGKTETIMPYYYDFGYQNYQSSIHVPVSRKFKGIVSFDVMHTDDWNPKLYIMPHKQRNDYSGYGKWVYKPSGKFNISLSGALSRTQFDRYRTKWQFNLENYRSDMRRGNLQAMNMNYLPDSRKLLTLTLSRLYTRRIYGVREPDEYGWFEDFRFKHYNSLQWPLGGINNPFGVFVPYMPLNGDYYIYQDKASLVYKTRLSANIQLHKYHEVIAGGEYTYQDFDNFTYFISSDTLHPITDEYRYRPKEHYAYLQDNIDYEGLFAKIGVRYDYFYTEIENIEPKINISPRFGLAFMVTEKFLFRANIGKYVQPPLYDHVYEYYNLWPFPSYIIGMKNIPPIGNPELKPEKTTSFEIGLDGELDERIMGTFNAFYKEITDLVGTRIIQSPWVRYVSFFNVEHANIKGLEAIFGFTYTIFNGKVSYTLSWARGSSSYAKEVYYEYYYDQPEDIEVPPAQEYDLDFDQRHRIFIQGQTKLPWQVQLNLFGYIGQGFPYTPPGPEGKYSERNIARIPFHRQVDCVLTKAIQIGKISLNLQVEIINALDVRYQLIPHSKYLDLSNIRQQDFNYWLDIGSSYYHPSLDFNHDGLVAPYEHYTSYRDFAIATDDWVNAYSAPRRARVGITLEF